MTPFELGFHAATICDNPFWKEYPKPSSCGHDDELAARAFVDGYVAGFRQRINADL